MANIINAGTNGVTVTGAASAVLNIQVGGTNALQIGTGATLTLSTPQVFPAGTAAAPSITTTGDVDTGMYFPAANQAAISAGGTVAAAFNSNGLFFRNRIINGDMRIDQRNAGASTTSGGYTLDRWQIIYGTGTLTSQQSTTVIPTGFTQSYGVTVTSAGTRLATDYFILTQLLEGLNISDLGFGAAGALTITLSFWVRSSVTGLYSGVLNSGDNNRSYGFTYSISVANTWEKKTITIPGDTSGGTTAYPVGTGAGMRLRLDLGSGTNYQTTADSWTATTNKAGVAGTVGWAQTAGATFYFTGVQFESGSVATPFERRPYGTELILCQRYFETGKGDARGAVNASTQVGNQINFRVTKRASATMTLTTVAGSPLSFGPTSESFLFYGTTSENTATWTAAAEL
jgi:hypothetical protein